MNDRGVVRFESRLCRSVGLVVVGVLLCATALAQDKGVDPPSSPVVGTSRPITVVPDLDSAQQVGGSFYWTRLVKVYAASFLKAHLVNVNLRVGDLLTLRSRSGQVIEQIVGRGPQDQGNFWALSAFGEELYLEFQFAAPYRYTPFSIDQIIVGNTDLLDAGAPAESICNPGDFENVICYQSDPAKWSNVLASVGVMTVGGNPANALWCSGSNVSPRNFVLTNNHCITNQSDCNSSEFVFKYYTLSCGGGATTNDWQAFRCDQLVAFSPFGSCDQGLNDLDFSLCSVIGDPASSYGSVTPDPVPLTDGEAIYIVQHPAGRPHEITHGGGSDVDVDGTVLRYYNTLDTEGGSSGSPIYRESDDKLIGLHHCGGCSTPGVGNRGMLMSDIYPQIAPFLCSPTLLLQAVGFDGPAELFGNGDALLDPGETWQFSPRVENAACAVTGQSVTAGILVNAASVSVTLLDTTASFGNILAGQTVSSAGPVRFRIGAGADCGGQVILDLVGLTATNGGPFADAPGLFTRGLGSSPISTLFQDDFASGLGAWTIVDGGTGGGPARTWTTGDPGGRGLSLPAPYAICDSDQLGSAFAMDEQLISPLVDASTSVTVKLQFSHDFNWFGGGSDEQADVDVRSAATGGSWVNVANFSGGDASGSVNLDISAQAALQSDVQVRFHYYNAVFEWWWAVDDVQVLAESSSLCADDFLTYGSGCAGSSGFTPALDAWGSASPGGAAELSVSGGQPGSNGFLVVASAPDLGGGCLLLSAPLFLAPLGLDGVGSVLLPVEIPTSAVSGVHFYLQWVGLDSGGPQKSFSNGLDGLVP